MFVCFAAKSIATNGVVDKKHLETCWRFSLGMNVKLRPEAKIAKYSAKEYHQYMINFNCKKKNNTITIELNCISTNVLPCTYTTVPHPPVETPPPARAVGPAPAAPATAPGPRRPSWRAALWAAPTAAAAGAAAPKGARERSPRSATCEGSRKKNGICMDLLCLGLKKWFHGFLIPFSILDSGFWSVVSKFHFEIRFDCWEFW